MRKAGVLTILVCLLAAIHNVSADTFGTGANQFTIDFVTISGSTNPTSGIPMAYGFTFTGVPIDYRMGKFEITNGQWNKFKAVYGTVTGNPSSAYNDSPNWTGMNIPANRISWYEAAQFVNYLNTSKGYQPAYKFTGTQGTINYTLDVWQAGDGGYNPSNPFRNSNAYYFLPTENEWVKAAYWNGTNLQTYATKPGETLHKSYGISGTGWNYDNYSYLAQPWDVGSGSEELNGTYDMMGNILEWMESPYYTGDNLPDSNRALRGGGYDSSSVYFDSFSRSYSFGLNNEFYDLGFRVATVIPEPASLLLLALGTMALRKKK